MSDNAAEFAKIKMLHRGAVLHQEGGKPVVLLPKLSFLSGGQSHTMDVLLYPSSHSGYDSRLFCRCKKAVRSLSALRSLRTSERTSRQFHYRCTISYRVTQFLRIGPQNRMQGLRKAPRVSIYFYFYRK
jgi:hypothetical protein